MTEQLASRRPTPALDRRTVIKGAAWAAPVIAVATAVPAVSATTEERDVMISGYTSGGQGANEAGTDRRVEQPNVTQVKLRDSSYLPAIDAVLTLTFDSRWYSAVDASQGGTPLVPVGSPVQNGNSVSRSFTVTLLTDADDLEVDIDLTKVSEELPYVEDLLPFEVSISTTSADPDPANNIETFPAEHVTTWDAEVGATWEERTITTADGPQVFPIPATATMTALAPGAYLSYADSDGTNGMLVNMPSDITDSVQLATVTLDGTSRPDLFAAAEQGSWGYDFKLNEAIPAGSTVQVTFAVATSDTDQQVVLEPSSIGVGLMSASGRERNPYNNFVEPPRGV